VTIQYVSTPPAASAGELISPRRGRASQIVYPSVEVRHHTTRPRCAVADLSARSRIAQAACSSGQCREGPLRIADGGPTDLEDRGGYCKSPWISRPARRGAYVGQPPDLCMSWPHPSDGKLRESRLSRPRGIWLTAHLAQSHLWVLSGVCLAPVDAVVYRFGGANRGDHLVEWPAPAGGSAKLRGGGDRPQYTGHRMFISLGQ